MLNLPAAGRNAKQGSLFLEMLICREQSSILSVIFSEALRCSLKQEITKYQWLSWLWTLPSVSVLVFPQHKMFVGKSEHLHLHGRQTHIPQIKFFPTLRPLYELLSLIHFSYVSPHKCTKTNIHCYIYEHSLIVTMVSKKTGKMGTKLDALHVRQA